MRLEDEAASRPQISTRAVVRPAWFHFFWEVIVSIALAEPLATLEHCSSIERHYICVALILNSCAMTRCWVSSRRIEHRL